MRILPDLEFLNGLPVDREALNESIVSERNNTQKKHEVADVIHEEDAEATIDEQPQLEHEDSVTQLHSSHLSGEPDSQQQIIGQHMDTSELEAIAICYDNIR